MKKVVALILTIGMLAAIPAAASASVPNIAVPTSCNGPVSTLRVAPSHIWLSCDPTLELARLQWQRWTMTGARAAGVVRINNCIPDCATGKFTAHSATIRLSRPEAQHGREVYTHLYVTARGLRPLSQPMGYAYGGWHS